MSDEFREEWRRWNEVQIIDLAVQIHRMARKISNISLILSVEHGRKPTFAEVEERVRNRFATLWPSHQFGLGGHELMTLADRSNSRTQDYFDYARLVAENWLWRQMKAKVHTDTLDLPINVLEPQ